MTTDTELDRVDPDALDYHVESPFPTPRFAMSDIGDWLRKGYADFKAALLIDLVYGASFVVFSWALLAGLVYVEAGWAILPMFAGFMLVGPLAGVGLYEVSRKLERGDKPGWLSTLFVRTASPGQIAYASALLAILLLAWIRSAMVIYALFFGVIEFPSVTESLELVFFTIEGWGMIVTGSIIGALFAGLAFLLSAFSIPMLVDKDVDVVTAMARSATAIRYNKRVMFAWGAVISIGTAIGVVTGLLAMIVIFPILGHATWHAYRALITRSEAMERR